MLEKTGHFTVYTDGEHCNGPERLLRGDILVTRTKGHTVAVLSDGAAAAQERAAVPAAQPTKAQRRSLQKHTTKRWQGHTGQQQRYICGLELVRVKRP